MNTSSKRGRHKRAPIPESALRAIQQVSGLKKVQKVLGLRRTSLGSLSEASSVFDSGLITPITETDRLAGVQRDMIVRLGSPKCQDDLSSSVRVIEIYHRDSCRQTAQVKGFF